MGRSIPSITHRISSKQAEWERFARLLGEADRRAFEELSAAARDRRSAIDALDEPDIGIALLLAIVTHLQVELDALRTSGKGGLGCEPADRPFRP